MKCENRINKVIVKSLLKLVEVAKFTYAILFTVVFWQPFIWNLIKPKDGVIDNKSIFIHKHAVRQLNICRGNSDGWALMSICRFKIRDPHAHIQKKYYHWSDKHLFVISK